MSIRITCINKNSGYHENSYTAITHLGWTEEATGKTGRNTRVEIYNWIKNQNGTAYVKDSSGNTAFLITAETAQGTQYVKTKPDSVQTDNLLKLPECP